MRGDVIKIMISDEIQIDILPAVFIIKNFIAGEDNCNYEKYLLELVNKSIYFREKSNFRIYEPPLSESNGECDCNSLTYKFDFKLLESTTRFQASRELTSQIQKISDCVISHCPPRKQNTEMKVTRLHVALRNHSCKKLSEFLTNEYEYGTIENDIKNYVKLLTVKKNLFFLFPYQFSFKKNYTFRFAIENINVALSNDFKESYLFREKNCEGFDTFFAYIYEDHLIVSSLKKDCTLQIVDTIYMFQSETYRKLYDYVYS